MHLNYVINWIIQWIWKRNIWLYLRPEGVYVRYPMHQHCSSVTTNERYQILLCSLERRKHVKPWAATDSVGGGSHTAVTPHLDKSAALDANSWYHCLLQLSQLKAWNCRKTNLSEIFIFSPIWFCLASIRDKHMQ